MSASDFTDFSSRDRIGFSCTRIEKLKLANEHARLFFNTGRHLEARLAGVAPEMTG